MLVNLLKKRNFFKQIFIIVLFTLLGTVEYNSFYLNDLEKVGAILTLLLIAFVGYTDYLNVLISKSAFSIFTYMLFLMPFIGELIDYKMIGSLLLVTYVSTKLLYFESEKNDPYSAFDIGVFLSFAILLNPLLIFLGIIIFIYFLTLKAVEPKVPILGVLGFIVPILIVGQISFLLDYYFILDFYKEQFTLNIIQPQLKYIFLTPTAVILVLSVLNHLKNVNKLTAQKKRIYSLIHLMFITILITFVLFGGDKDVFLVFLSYCVMTMLSRYFIESKPKIEWLNEALLWIYMISLLIYNFYDRIPRFYSLITEVSL